MNNRIKTFKKGPSSRICISTKNFKLIDKYRRYNYGLEGTYLSQRDVIDKICKAVDLEKSVNKKEIELRRLGKFVD